MAKACAACGSHLIRHETDQVSCAHCGAKSYEDGSGVVPDDPPPADIP